MSSYVAANNGLYAKCNKRILPRTSLTQPIINSGTGGLGEYLAFSGQPYYYYKQNDRVSRIKLYNIRISSGLKEAY